MLPGLKTVAIPFIKRAVITGGLEAAAVASALGLARGMRGTGAIFTLHHVRPQSAASFQPNAHLDVTPEFLDKAILALKADGYEFVPLADVPARLSGKRSTPFACFTLDDGFRDNASFAAPVFTRHGVPFTIFLTQGFIDVTHSLWWETLGALLNSVSRVAFDFGRGTEILPADSYATKGVVFDRIADFINSTDEAEAVARLDEVALQAGIDPLAITRDLTMREDELKALAGNPLVSYGAHTVSHRGLARLVTADAEYEIAQSAARVAAITGRMPTSFAYPYGDGRSVSGRERAILKSLGMPVGVTTGAGVLRSEMAADMTALPRISLNGFYQQTRYVRALASGIPFGIVK